MNEKGKKTMGGVGACMKVTWWVFGLCEAIYVEKGGRLVRRIWQCCDTAPE